MEAWRNPIGRYLRIGETSNGKDTMTGTLGNDGNPTRPKPFKTFTETGFSTGTDRRTGKALW